MLVLKTAPYHATRTLDEEISELLQSAGISDAHLARLIVKSGHVEQRDMASLYRSADAFVLPSRGEGWGRPHVEAMAMGLPVIATNWSGSTEFLRPDASYPLPIDGLEEITSVRARLHFAPC